MKRVLLNALALALPLLLLAGTELVLRWIDYGGDTRAVATVERGGRVYYTMNQRVGKRFFGVDRLYYQKGSRDFFEVAKQPNTLRIFLLGASTTAGFPYEYQATPSWLLHDRLAAAFPDKQIEVINTAITAINSYTVVELVKELVHYSPDLFIVYMGQNEFYGIYGVGSTQSIGGQRWLVKTYLWLLRFKTTQLIRDLIFSLSGESGLDEGNGEGAGPTTMEQMSGKAIRYGDAEYRAATQTYEDNYAEIIRTARRNGVSVLLSTLVANEKDLKPFVSFHAEELSEDRKAAWEKLLETGRRAEREGAYEAAIASYIQAAAIDSTPARLYFRLGKSYEALGEGEKARAAFVRARDLDGLRFRAPSEFNEVVRRLEEAFDAPVADIAAVFRAQSPNGSLGKELLWEHVHPNLDGYFLMAKTWLSAMKEHHLLVSSDAWAATNVPPDSVLRERAVITPVDEAVGRIKIAKLLSRPPFQSGEAEPAFTPQTLADQVAYEYVAKRELSWGKAHLKAAGGYRQAGDPGNALAEYRAVDKVEGGNPTVRGLMGDVLIDLGRYDEAEPLLVEALAAEENPYLRYRLGVLHVMTDRPQQAIEDLQRSLQLIEAAGAQLSPNQLADVNYHLALANFQAGHVEPARGILQSLVQQNPADGRAIALLAQLPRRDQ